MLFASLATEPQDQAGNGGGNGGSSGGHVTPEFSIIFPTADEVRRSLDGYGSGGSIHMKLQSAAHHRQLHYLRPYLCLWAGDSQHADAHAHAGKQLIERREAGRRRAAPHIKTYMRFSDGRRMDSLDWALVTSANVSTQAWGTAVSPASGEVKISSWEMGVLVWPALFRADDSDAGRAVMQPCFQQDLPDNGSDSGRAVKSCSAQDEPACLDRTEPAVVVGLRMPYDVPLTRYGRDDAPWCATAAHTEPDWKGQTWT